MERGAKGNSKERPVEGSDPNLKRAPTARARFRIPYLCQRAQNDFGKDEGPGKAMCVHRRQALRKSDLSCRRERANCLLFLHLYPQCDDGTHLAIVLFSPSCCVSSNSDPRNHQMEKKWKQHRERLKQVKNFVDTSEPVSRRKGSPTKQSDKNKGRRGGEWISSRSHVGVSYSSDLLCTCLSYIAMQL